MKKLTTAIILLSAFVSTSVLGQGQANVWYVGNGAGLDFATVPPTVLQDGNAGLYTFTGEGVGAICNASGTLLFYTNGNIVYNKNHVAMTMERGCMETVLQCKRVLLFQRLAAPLNIILFLLPILIR